MKMNLVTFCLIALVAAVGCTDSVSPPALNSPIEFSLRYGSAVTIDDGELAVTFTRLLADSRCPTNVICIWAGEAWISMTLSSKSGRTITIPLGVDGAEMDTVRALNYVVDTLGYQFSLRSLTPYPADPDKPIPLRDYFARIRVQQSVANAARITIIDGPPQQFLLSSYDVDSAAVAGDTLSLWVNYGGGCKQHEFHLFMTPADCAESNPVQANLYLQHIDRFDQCEALVHEWLDFDISAIAEAYRDAYQSGGAVRLNVFEYRSSILVNVKQVVYDIP